MTAPLIVRSFRTRGYELDQQSLIPATAMLRYMEQMRWLSLDEPRLNVGRLFLGGHFMVVAGQRLAIERDIGFNVELKASLWLARVGRTSLEFGHAFEQEPGEELVARGRVTAVYLDGSGRPTPVPDDLRAHVRAEEPGHALEGPEPVAAIEGAGVWSRELEVRPSDVDLLHHVNHAVYLTYVEDTRALCAAAGGYGEESARALGRARGVSINYLAQVGQGEKVVVRTRTLGPGEYGFELTRAGRPACRATVQVA